MFTTADQELIDAVRVSLPDGCVLRQEAHRPYDWKVINAVRSVPVETLQGVSLHDPASLVRSYAAGASCAAIAARLPVSEGTYVFA